MIKKDFINTFFIEFELYIKTEILNDCFKVFAEASCTLLHVYF